MSKFKTKSDNAVDMWRGVLKSAPDLVSEMGEQAAHEVVELIAEGFEKQRDPYGRKWDTKKVDDGRSILVGKTVRLRRGWNVRKLGNGRFLVAPSVEYAAAHQDPRPRPLWGGKKLPQRMMIPTKARGLPEEWKRRIEATIDAAMTSHFGGPKGVNLGFLAYKIIGLKRRFSISAIVKRAIREATAD